MPSQRTALALANSPWLWSPHRPLPRRWSPRSPLVRHRAPSRVPALFANSLPHALNSTVSTLFRLALVHHNSLSPTDCLSPTQTHRPTRLPPPTLLRAPFCSPLYSAGEARIDPCPLTSNPWKADVVEITEALALTARPLTPAKPTSWKSSKPRSDSATFDP